MADEQPTHRSKGPAIGVVGALMAIASIWWFALRPRGKQGGEPPAASSS